MLYDMQTQSILFIWRGVGIANVSPNYVMLWQTLDSVPLRIVIKPKILKEALQWRFERGAQVESYVVTSIKPNKRIEPTMQYTSLL